MILKLLSYTHALSVILIGKTHKSGLADWSTQWRAQWPQVHSSQGLQ